MQKGEISINEAFTESKFRLFKTYCEEQQLFYLKDIDREVIEKFAEVKGIGGVKMAAIIERLAGPVGNLQLELLDSSALKKK
ncbi:hypothetical protein [Carnobacterium divergens]|uniref:hypothetical protein n=1 Tax=Carnobacterium divergens TaxID=2748 RepID=UPI00128D0BF6|nr:hypothetical protein [Carnobacterium divergens]MPQ21615.1 hypothetical protein [Carnobacterium divergens]